MPSDEKATQEPTPLTTLSAEPSSKTKKIEKTQKSQGFLFAMMFGLLIVAAAAIFYLWNANQSLSTALAHFSQQVESTQQQVTALQTKDSALQQEVATQGQTLQTQAETLQEWRNYLPKGPSRGFVGRVLSADVWVRLANTNLLLNHDVNMATHYLTQAATELDGINNAEIDPLKKALATDLAHLKNSAWVNTTEVYQRLIALEKQVTRLPLMTVPAEKTPVNMAEETENVASWRVGLRKTWETMRQLIVVYHLPGTDTPPFITPDQGPYIYQSLVASLNEASWAALHGDDKVYHASLQRASEWVRQYFLQSAPETEKLLAELKELDALSLQSTKDLVLESPKIFQDYLKSVQ